MKGSGEALNGIVESIRNVNQIIEEIANSSHEQSIGVNQVNDAITQIDSAVQQNAALVEETAATAEELGNMSEMMNRNISQFKINQKASGLSNKLQTGNMDFGSAVREIRQSRVTVRAYINDVDIALDAFAAADDSITHLGQWIQGEGQIYEGHASFKTLTLAHKELYSLVGKTLQFKDNGELESANTAMNQLEKMSHEVIGLINRLESDMS